VINLRGRVVPVVDLAVKLGLPESPITKWTCVVVVEVDLEGERTVMGVLADSVSQVLDLAASEIEPPPPFGARVRVGEAMDAQGSADLLSREPGPTCRPLGGAARSLSVRDFRLFQQLIHREAGIHLAESKRVLVEGRLARRLRELQLDYRAYYALVEADEVERVRLVDAISTNETSFFREPRQFEFLENRVFPEWQARAQSGRLARSLRVWSAACSSGEEPYSLAMAFLARFPPESGLSVEILATDISTRVLERARSAVYPIERSKQIPTSYLKAFMLRGSGTRAGLMKASPEIRSVVRFARVNLNAEPFPVSGPFDLILCRNVLIYFDAPSKARIVERLLERLDPQGYLVLGHAEALIGLRARARGVGPTIYAHAANGPQGPAHEDR
jgi:chemotaxis protein methyltransferase CheR